MAVAEIHQNKLKKLKEKVEMYHEYWRENNVKYNEDRKFLYKTSFKDEDIGALKSLKKPQLEFNFLEAFTSRLVGEFAKQEPSITVRAADGCAVDPKVISVVENHMRSILMDANNDGLEVQVYKEMLSGGFSGLEVYTKYKHGMSFEQDICVGKIFDPTLMGFDPLARTPHKGDGQFCFKLYPKYKKEFQEEYPNIDLSNVSFAREISGFSWSFQSNKDDVLLICEFDERKKIQKTLVRLADNRVMYKDDYEDMLDKWNRIEQAPIVVDKRKTMKETICRYTFIENQVIDYKETSYDFLPLVFADGNSVQLRESEGGEMKQFTRSYIYNAKDTQRLANFSGSSLANELENMVQHKWLAAIESVPPEYKDAYMNPQLASSLLYNAFHEGNTTVPLPPPQPVVRPPIPPEIANTFGMTTQLMQSILGSYDASLGVNDNQLSGVAIIEGATQSNAAAMPYVIGYLQALNQVAQIIVNLIPKYYVTPRTIPVRTADGKDGFQVINNPNDPDSINVDYAPNALEVRVSAGVNFSVQKSRALQQIIGMMQASPIFAQFMNQEGLDVLLDNLEIRGIDLIKDRAEQFMQQLKQQQQMQMQMAQQNNPMIIKQQELQLKAQDQALEQQKFVADKQNQGVENQIEIARVQAQTKDSDNDRLNILLKAFGEHDERVIQAQKAAAENERSKADVILKAADQSHGHLHDAAKLAHEIDKSDKEHELNKEKVMAAASKSDTTAE